MFIEVGDDSKPYFTLNLELETWLVGEFLRDLKVKPEVLIIKRFGVDLYQPFRV